MTGGRTGAARRLLSGLAGRLFPPSCVLCGSCVAAGRAPVCDSCWSRLPRAVPPLCRRCGAPGPRFLDGLEACGECIEWEDGPARVRAPYLMRAGGARLVRALKYSGWTALADRMGRAMAPSARRMAADGETGSAPALVPVPLSPARRRRRGFNQSASLARALGGAVGWPVASVLRRAGRARRQARLGGGDRRDNVKGVFRARPAAGDSPSPDRSRGRATAVVVDDVVTTGSTAAACESALREAGWRPLGTVAFARSVGEGPGSGR